MITRLSDQQLNNRITLFSNLHEKKVIYRESITAIIELKDLSLTYNRLHATAHVTTILSAPDWRIEEGIQDWEIGTTWWGSHCFSEKRILAVPYAGWMVWTDREFVSRVEGLVRDGRLMEAQGMIKSFV